MDLNQLYFDHQLLLIRAERAASGGARDGYKVSASQIGRMQRALGAAAAPIWEALTAVDGTSLAAPFRHQQDYAS